MDVKHAKRLLVEEQKRLRQLEKDVEESGELDESQQESSGALTSHDQHPGDAGSQTFERERDVSIGEGLATKRREVADALDRIENDRYGMCEVCGRQISEERLEAIPATRYCAEHAAEVDGAGSAKGGWDVTPELGPEDD